MSEPGAKKPLPPLHPRNEAMNESPHEARAKQKLVNVEAKYKPPLRKAPPAFSIPPSHQNIIFVSAPGDAEERGPEFNRPFNWNCDNFNVAIASVLNHFVNCSIDVMRLKYRIDAAASPPDVALRFGLKPRKRRLAEAIGMVHISHEVDMSFSRSRQWRSKMGSKLG